MRRGCILAVVLAAAPAAADIDNEKADRLFSEAVALRDTDPTAACKLFEEALSYNPQAISTRLNVALCDERFGRIASAVEKFTEVADRARQQKLAEFQNVAEQRLAVLTPELAFVTFTFAEPPVAETKLLVDDRVIPLDKLQKRPIDPGDRVIVVTAPGRVAYRTRLTIGKRDTRTVVIPKLEPAVASRRTIGKITVVAGGATVATGLVLGLVARGRYNNALTDACKDPGGGLACPADQKARIDSAITLGNVGTVVTIVGLAAGGAGGYLWWRSARAHERTRGVTYLGPHVGSGVTGIAAAGRF